MNTDPRENKAVQDFIAGSGDAWEKQTAEAMGLYDVIPYEHIPVEETNSEWIHIVEHEEAVSKVIERRDRWKERYEGAKSGLIHEKKKNHMLADILVDLIIKGDLRVVAAARNR